MCQIYVQDCEATSSNCSIHFFWNFGVSSSRSSSFRCCIFTKMGPGQQLQQQLLQQLLPSRVMMDLAEILALGSLGCGRKPGAPRGPGGGRRRWHSWVPPRSRFKPQAAGGKASKFVGWNVPLDVGRLSSLAVRGWDTLSLHKQRLVWSILVNICEHLAASSCDVSRVIFAISAVLLCQFFIPKWQGNGMQWDDSQQP